MTNTNQIRPSTNLSDRTDAEGDLISLDAIATDPDGDTADLRRHRAAGRLSINTATGRSAAHRLSAASGSPYRSLTVRDGRGQRHRHLQLDGDQHQPDPTFDQNLGDRPTPRVT